MSIEKVLMNMENSKTNEPHKPVLNSSRWVDLRSSNKHVTLQKLFIYYTWKKLRKQYKKNKIKTIPSTYNDEFELPDRSYSVSDSQDCIECIIKNHETLTAIPLIIYINKINNRLVFQIKIGYKLELQTPETMKLFGSTKK